MFGLGTTELIVLLLIVLVVFGARKVPEVGRSLGEAIREFKDSVTGVRETASQEKKDTNSSPPKQES